ncbi:5-oxoprolinase subunit B family protein [Methylocystis heyeri]|uniref:Carboxyltransferase domain-containing protein n=1 Tax=Methylocystis heyeri TaxID=391905 RepID=A0A6B8KI36_9HYPH|nr:allophanate hydrolase subunit 1 [Methylocystis heyeri]QGM47292.1 carboxyltransferase domain-containing protein [Methylocystis heyeri]
MTYPQPRFLDAGEAALVVEFGDSVDPALNARVLCLEAALQNAAPRGIEETIPTYRSLMVLYDPLVVSRAELVSMLKTLAPGGFSSKAETGSHEEDTPEPNRRAETSPKGACWRLPCCYDPELAEDIALAAQKLDLTCERLAATHAGADYRVYMYGFAPGWCYLGGLPRELALPRRAAPRGPTPQGAVLIGGGLSLVATNPMPTGWYVIGRTPERMFSLERDPPTLIQPGDAIRFEPVDIHAFRALDARAASGESLARREETP